MLRIINENEEYFYLSIQDVRFIKPSGSGANVEVILKDGSVLKIENVSVKRIDQLVTGMHITEIKQPWSYKNVR